MKLYRLCSKEEIDAIKANGFEKLTYGGCLFRYSGFWRCNDYPVYKNLWEDVCQKNGEERVKSVLKVFKGIDSQIPLFESSVLKKQEICKKFAPNSHYFEGDNFDFWSVPNKIFDILHNCNENDDQVFLISVKVAGFFDKLTSLHGCYNQLGSLDKTLLQLDFPAEIATKFKGEGFYNSPSVPSCTEYALPMYMIEPKHVDNIYNLGDKALKLGDKEIKKIKKDYKCLTKAARKKRNLVYSEIEW